MGHPVKRNRGWLVGMARACDSIPSLGSRPRPQNTKAVMQAWPWRGVRVAMTTGCAVDSPHMLPSVLSVLEPVEEARRGSFQGPLHVTPRPCPAPQSAP